MQKITLKVPDQKYSFFLELMSSLGFEVSDDAEIPQWHKDEVEKRMELSNQTPERLVDWELVKNNLELNK